MEDVWATFQEDAGLLADTIEGIREHLERDSFGSVTLEMYKNKIQNICISRIDDDMTEDDVFEVYCSTFKDIGIDSYFIRNYYIELFYMTHPEVSLLVIRNTLKKSLVPLYAISVSELFKRLNRVVSYTEDKSVLYEVAKVLMLNVRFIVAAGNKHSGNKLTHDDYRRIIRRHFYVTGLSGSEQEKVYLTQVEMTGKLVDIEYDSEKGEAIHPDWVEVLTDDDYASVEEMEANNNFDALSDILTNPNYRARLPKNIHSLIPIVIQDYEERPVSTSYDMERRKKIFGDCVSVITRNNRFYGSRQEAIKRIAETYGVPTNKKLLKDCLPYVRTGYSDFTEKYDYDGLYRIMAREIVKVLDYFEDYGRNVTVLYNCIQAFWFDCSDVRTMFREFIDKSKNDREIRKKYREAGVEDGYIINYEIQKYIRRV